MEFSKEFLHNALFERIDLARIILFVFLGYALLRIRLTFLAKLK